MFNPDDLNNLFIAIGALSIFILIGTPLILATVLYILLKISKSLFQPQWKQIARLYFWPYFIVFSLIFFSTSMGVGENTFNLLPMVSPVLAFSLTTYYLMKNNVPNPYIYAIIITITSSLGIISSLIKI